VVDLVTRNEDLSTLARLEAADCGNPVGRAFYCLRPTNKAFEALPEGELDRLLANPEEWGAELSRSCRAREFRDRCRVLG